MPPGFMNATFAPPKSVGDVAASWASAIASPSVVSPWFERVRSAVIRPTTRLTIGPAIALYRSISDVMSGSLGTSRVTTRFSATIWSKPPVFGSMVASSR